jgi:putative zincin peptidase
MRFCFGKVPPNEEFHPERDGWRKIREPNFLALYAAGIPIAALTVVALSIAITSVGDQSATIVVKPGDVTPARVVIGLVLVAGGFLAALVIHEVVHLVAHPGVGLSRDSVIGIWPSRGVAYAHYDGEITRNRFICMAALPFVVLSLGPVFWFWASGHVNIWLAFLALFNGIGSSFDILVIGICLAQIPGNAVMRNNGWLTYWRPKGR